MKLGIGLVLTLATMMFAAAADCIRIADSGDFTIGGLRFALLHRNQTWQKRPQDRNSIRPDAGFPKRENGKFELAGRFFPFSGNPFRLTETIRFTSVNSLSYKVFLTAEPALESRLLALNAVFPVSEFGGRTFLFNGKKFGFDADFAPARWQILFPPQQARLEIPLAGGRLVISGRFGLRLQDERKFNIQRWSLCLMLAPNDGAIRKAEGAFEFRFEPYRSTPVSLAGAANMGFADQVVDDGKGGWTDQGPENDLRMYPAGACKYAGISFDVVKPEENNGRACLLFGGKYRLRFPLEFTIPADGKQGKYLYLLHADAWEQKEGVALGTVELQYADGTTGSVSLRSGIDIGNFWNPLSRANAKVVWSGANRSARVGLYLSRFPIADKALRAIRLRSAGNAVWLVVGMTLSPDYIKLPSRQVVIMTANADWHPLPAADKVKAGSVLDFSRWLEAPAGKDGYVEADSDGRLVFGKTGRRVRFWGANICQNALFVTADEGKKLVDDYARYGYNWVRLHQFDHKIYRRNGKDTSQLDAGNLDRLDRLAAAFKARGIYWTIDLYTRRVLAPGELPEFPDREVRMEQFRPLVYVSEPAMRNWERAAQNLLTHVNPYTGLAWKDDPALVSICLLNEDSAFGVWNRDPVVKAIYEKKFAEECRVRGIAVPTGDAYDREIRGFINRKYRQGYERMAAFLRKLGVKALLTSQNHWGVIASAPVRSQYDLVDTHFYWGHPEFLGKGWTLPAVVSADDSVRMFAGQLNDCFGQRVLGKPFTVTEWDYVNPGAYAVQGAFLVGAYAALQDWDGLCRFTYTHDPGRVLKSGSPIFLFDMAGDPMRSLSERAGALFYLRGDVRASQNIRAAVISPEATVRQGVPDFIPEPIRRLGLMSQTGVIAVGGQKTPTALPERVRELYSVEPDWALPANWNVPRFEIGKGEVPPQLKCENDVFRSDTGELTLDAPNGIWMAKTLRSEGFLLPAGKTAAGKFARVQAIGSYAAILVAAMDEAPLAQSRHMLILHLTEVKNTAMRFGDREMTLVEDWGKLPQLMRRGEARLELARTLKNARLKALDFDGTPLFDIPVETVGGKSVLTLRNVVRGRSVAAYELWTE